MQNILILLDYYLQNLSVNGICCEKIANELINRGLNVVIGTFGKGEAQPPEGERAPKVCRTWEGYRPTTNMRWPKKLKGYIRWMLPGEYPASQDKKITKSVVEAAKKIIADNDIDTVICVHIPAETLIAGVLIKKEFPRLKVYAYMLDPLFGGFVPRFLPRWYTNLRNRVWENNILSHYDRAILMEASRRCHDKYNKRDVWYKKAVYLDVPLLSFPEERKTVQGQQDFGENRTIEIAYCGSLEYPRRNVAYFLRLIKEQNNQNIRYTFAGATNHPELFADCADNVRYLGRVSHDRVCELLNGADILLNLGVKVPSAISGKIFEYMSCGKPIISTCSIDDEACIPYLKKYPLSLLLDERESDLRAQSNVLNQFIEGHKNKRVDIHTVEEMFYQSTPKAFVDLLCKDGGNAI